MKVTYTIKDEEKQIILKPVQEGWEVIWDNSETSIQPMFDYVLIEKDAEKTTTAGGLVIPDSSKEKPSTGTVMAIGQGAVAENGTITPMFVNVGDRVVFPRFSGKVVKVGDEEKTLIKQSDILGIIR